MSKLKSILSKYKLLIESFISLYLLNGLDLILPLVSLPYILRVVGPSNYGIYAFVIVIIQYIQTFTNYGFNFSVTKQIAAQREDTVKVQRIFHSVIITRILIAILLIFVVYITSWFLFDDSQYWWMLVWGAGMIVGELFIPVWLFQGLEKMRYLTIVNLISKSIFTVLIFFVILKPEDFQLLIMLNSLGSISAGIVSLIIVYKILLFRFVRPSYQDIIFQLKDGLAIFGSTISMNLYRNSNVFILGLFVSESSVGIYAAAEKVIKAIQSVASPISQALFPHLGNKFSKNNIRENIASLLNISKYLALIFFLMAVITFFGSSLLMQFFGGNQFSEAEPLIQIFVAVIFFGGLNYILGIVGLVNLNEQKKFFTSVMISGTFSLGFLLFTVKLYGNYAAVWSMVLSEVILFGFCFFYLIKLYKKAS